MSAGVSRIAGLDKRARRAALLLRAAIDDRMGAYRSTDGVSWLFIATLPNSGSTALAHVLNSSPRAIMLTKTGEGQWLVPELSGPVGRWDPDLPVDYGRLRRIWLSRVRRRKGAEAVVIEKSPANFCRLRAIVAAFDDMPTTVLRLTRDPYAVCSSWAKRYEPRVVIRRWAPEYADAITDEKSFLTALGAICGRRMEELHALSDIVDRTVSYEALTSARDEAGAAILATCPALESLSMDAPIKVKDYAAARLSNKNESEIDRLGRARIGWITEGLSPYADAVESFGYRLRTADDA